MVSKSLDFDSLPYFHPYNQHYFLSMFFKLIIDLKFRYMNSAETSLTATFLASKEKCPSTSLLTIVTRHLSLQHSTILR